LRKRVQQEIMDEEAEHQKASRGGDMMKNKEEYIMENNEYYDEQQMNGDRP